MNALEFIGLVCVLTLIKVVGWGLVICTWIAVFEVGYRGGLRATYDHFFKGAKK